MSALIILVVVLVWARIGFVLWRWLIRPKIKSPRALSVTTLALAGIWFVGPILDEILGAQEFERFCQEIPKNKFYGPIAVGPGEFFDDLGQRHWRNIEELLAIIRSSKTWDQLIGNGEEDTKIAMWPIEVVQSKTTYFERLTGRPIVEYFYRGSQGGWIKRLTGWGMHAPYQCRSKEPVPNYVGWIVFKSP